MRTLVAALTLTLCAAGVAAQPLDPYAPAPTTPTRDVEVDTAVAAALVARARVLIADGDDASARQLVIEAVARQPASPVDAEAQALQLELDRRLAARLPPPSPPVVPPVDLDPEPTPPPEEPPPSAARPVAGTRAMAFYAALAGSAVGAAIAGVDNGGATAAAIAAGAVGGGALGLWAARRRGDDRVAAHLIGAGVVWGGAAGGLFADVVSGLEDTTANQVAVGVAVGAIGGAVLGAGLRTGELTVGDAAVIDATAALGTLAAFQLGLAMAPVETEGYSLNGAIGALGGFVVGHITARRIDVTPARVAKVTALGAAGAALPWLLWAGSSDDTTDDDEQAFGLLSLAGLAGGVYLGVRITRDAPGATGRDDAPVALLRKSERGGWSLGSPSLAPLTTAGGGRGVAVGLVAGAW